MKKNDLTIILTLKGRHLHTLRWMWHANRIYFPYHIIIADGEVHPTINRLLSDPATFKNLSFEYHRYSDMTFSDFYEKCTKTIRQVQTSYVMLSDNDDFPILTGIQKSITYLDDDLEYVCAGGKVPDFSIVSRRELPSEVIGQMNSPRFGYKYRSCDNSNSPISERVLDEINNYQLTYYHVYRTQALRTIYDEIKVHDFLDSTAFEYFIALRAVTLGKVRTDHSVICYIRQRGTSLIHLHYKDWVHNLLHGRLPQDYCAMATTIANEVERITGHNASEFKETILDAYAKQIRHMLGHCMLRYRFPKLFRIKQKLLWLKKIQLIPVWYQRRQEEKKFWKALANDVKDAVMINAYKEEFGKIESSLQGDEFLSFIKINASDLIRGG